MLQDRGITADVLQLFNDERKATDSLFHSDKSKADGSLKNPSFETTEWRYPDYVYTFRGSFE